MKQLFFFVSIYLLCVPIASADMFQPSHSCSKPFKPYNFSSQREVDSFNDDVQNYKRCIMRFVEDQKQEAQNHLDAGEDAIDDWNNFVRWELD